MPTSPIGEDTRRAWADVSNAHRRVTREAERRLQEAGLPPLVWYDVMQTLCGSPDGRMTQTALAARVQVSPSGLSRLVDRMVSRGLIERREVPGDRRATELALREEATTLCEEIWDVYGGVLAEHFAPSAAGREATISGVFSETSDSLEGICRTRIAEAEADADAEGGGQAKGRAEALP